MLRSYMLDEDNDELYEVDENGEEITLDDTGDDDDEYDMTEEDDAGVDEGDMRTPIADKYARRLHKMPPSMLVRLGKHDEVRQMYDLASDELSQRGR